MDYLGKLVVSFFSNCIKGHDHQKGRHTPFMQHGSEGGLFVLPEESVQLYVQQIFSLDLQDIELTPGVAKLQKIILEDPILRSHWEHGISLCKNLKGKNGKKVIKAINNVLHTPPAFNKSQFIGFPINAIFLDFMQTENGRTFFSSQKVNNAIKDILIRPTSVQHLHQREPKGWFCESARKKINYCQFLQYNPQKPHFGFNSWNHWFLRTFKPGMRPVGHGTPLGVPQKNVIVNSCQCTPLILPEQPVRNVKHTDCFWLKDNKYSLVDMFSARGNEMGYPALFQRGIVYQAYLSAYNYHHWHSPVDGQIIDVYSIPGTYYLTQSQYLGHYDPLSPNESQTFLSATVTRLVFVIKAHNPKIGFIALVYIGMTEVSSCVPTLSKGQNVVKGEHIGHFAYGGSTHAIIFQKSAKLTFSNKLYTSNNVMKEPVDQKLATYLAHVE